MPVALGLGLLLALADRHAGLLAWWTLRSDVASARERVAVLRSEIDQLRSQEQALESDAFAIEQAIREDLLLARAGEVVVRVPIAADRPTR